MHDYKNIKFVITLNMMYNKINKVNMNGEETSRNH